VCVLLHQTSTNFIYLVAVFFLMPTYNLTSLFYTNYWLITRFEQNTEINMEQIIQVGRRDLYVFSLGMEIYGSCTLKIRVRCILYHNTIY